VLATPLLFILLGDASSRKKRALQIHKRKQRGIFFFNEKNDTTLMRVRKRTTMYAKDKGGK